MSIQRWSERIWVVKLADEPALSEDLLTVKAEAEHAAAAPDIVLDLADVRLINSSNLSQLLRLRKVMVDRERRLRLAAMPKPVLAVFLTTGLDKVFEFSADVPTALTQLQMKK